MGAQFKVNKDSGLVFETQTSSKERIDLIKKQYESMRDTKSN